MMWAWSHNKRLGLGVRVSHQSPDGQVAWFKGKYLLANTNPHSIVYLLSTIKDWDLLHLRHFGVVFERLLWSAEITNENEFQFSGSPTPRISNDITFSHAHNSLLQYGFFSEPPRRRQMPKGDNLKRSESLLFSGDIESLELSKFQPYRLLTAGIASELQLINLLTGQDYPDEPTSKSVEQCSINNR